MLAALRVNHGIVSNSAHMAGITRQCHYSWLKKDPNYALAVEDINNIALDTAESALFSNILAGKESSLIFFLKCKGKERGYIEKQVIDHNISVPMNESALEFFEAPTEQPKAIEEQPKEEVDEFAFLDYEEELIEEQRSSNKDLLNKFKKGDEDV